MFNRQDLLEKTLKWRDFDVIKVLTGIRRCGKSTLMMMVKENLVANGVATENIAYINFEDRQYNNIYNPEMVWEILDKQLTGIGKKYILLDEIQRISNFEKLVDAIYSDKQYDVYITGSNAWMLSGELATYLSGRYIEVHLTPFSFYEYMSEAAWNKYDALLSYEKYGGFPMVRTLLEAGRAADISQYLEGIFNTVLLKDVAVRNKLTDTTTLHKISEYLFDNIGNLTSIKRMCDNINAGGKKISYHVVDNYVQALCDAFLIYKCDRLNLAGMEIFKSGAKYYAVDTRLRYYLNGNRAGDSGRILENIVFIELKRRFGQVFCAQTRTGKEIDFVTRRGDQTYYFQVAESVKESQTLSRELAPLQELKDNYPKYLITADFSNKVDHGGIIQMNIWDFLLENSHG